MAADDLDPRMTRAVADLVTHPGNEDVITLDQVVAHVAATGFADADVAAFVTEMAAYGYRGEWDGNAFKFRREKWAPMATLSDRERDVRAVAAELRQVLDRTECVADDLDPRMPQAVADIVMHPGNEDVITLDQVVSHVTAAGLGKTPIGSLEDELAAYGYKGAWEGKRYVFRRGDEQAT